MNIIEVAENRRKWDLRFLALAAQIATWSKDPSTQVGAVLVSPQRRILSTGFNGLPQGVHDSPELLQNRDVKLLLTMHAEENALLDAPRVRLDLATLYTTHQPCAHCMAQMAQCGVGRVVFQELLGSRWTENAEWGRRLAADVGIGYERIAAPAVDDGEEATRG